MENTLFQEDFIFKVSCPIISGVFRMVRMGINDNESSRFNFFLLDFGKSVTGFIKS